MDKYKCVRDYQGTDWFIDTVATIDEWRELAISWADNEVIEVRELLETCNDDEVLDYITEFWQIDFEKVEE